MYTRVPPNQFHPVSPTVAAGAPLANCVEVQHSTDCAEVSPLAVAGGGMEGFSSDSAGAASLVVAEVASSADIAGEASSADLAGMAFPAIAGVASLADLAGMALLADIVGAASPADLARMAFPAIAGVASSTVAGVVPLAVPEVVSLAVTVEVTSSTDFMVVADSFSMCSSQCDNDWLVPDGYVKDSQDVVFPGSSDLGDPTVVIPSVEGKYNYVAND